MHRSRGFRCSIGRLNHIRTTSHALTHERCRSDHNPLRVVEIFRMLEALHPGRIDLGLGRAPGSDPVTAAELQRGTGDDPNSRLAEVLAFDGATFPHEYPFRGIVPMHPVSRCP